MPPEVKKPLPAISPLLIAARRRTADCFFSSNPKLTTPSPSISASDSNCFASIAIPSFANLPSISTPRLLSAAILRRSTPGAPGFAAGAAAPGGIGAAVAAYDSSSRFSDCNILNRAVPPLATPPALPPPAGSGVTIPSPGIPASDSSISLPRSAVSKSRSCSSALGGMSSHSSRRLREMSEALALIRVASSARSTAFNCANAVALRYFAISAPRRKSSMNVLSFLFAR